MKKFEFSLDRVLSYREQVVNNLLIQHAQILELIRAQEELLRVLEHEERECGAKLEDEKRNGCTICVVQVYEGYIKSQNMKMRIVRRKISELEREAEAKMSEIVEANKDKKSIDILKDKRREEYDKDVRRAEEKFIEEFVSNTSSGGTR